MKKLSLLLIVSILYFIAPAQNIGMGTSVPDASAQLDVTSASKGVLIPRMGTADIISINGPAKGLMVYDSVKNQLMVNMGYPLAPNWQTIVFNSGWNLTGNTGTSPSSNFMGTTDDSPLQFRVNNVKAGLIDQLNNNVFMGSAAGLNMTSGSKNIFVGSFAGMSNTVANENIGIGNAALYSNISSTGNIAIGDSAGYANTASGNVFIGRWAGRNNVSAISNTFIGTRTGFQNTTGHYNTATGYESLYSNYGGVFNSAYGYQSLNKNTVGNSNTAIGYQSLFSNTTGDNNTALGVSSLRSNTTGSYNAALGIASLSSNTTGGQNTALGNGALQSNTSGHYNTSVGYYSLHFTTASQFNTAVGYDAGGSFGLGYNNTIIGAQSDASFAGQYNIVAIGQGTVCPDHSTARIGNAATWSIGGFAGWSNVSDGRFKKDIKEDVKGIDFIMKIRPVTYRLDITGLSKQLKENQGEEWNEQMKTAITYKEQMVFSGFVAQEVENAAKVAGYDFSGVDKPRDMNGVYGLRYAEFVVPLVKAVQEQQQQIEMQKIMLEEFKIQNEALIKRIEFLEKK